MRIMNEARHQVSLKPVIIGAVVIVCGLALLVVNPFSHSPDKRVNPLAARPSAGSVKGAGADEGFPAMGSGVSDYDLGGKDDLPAARVLTEPARPGLATNAAGIVEFRARLAGTHVIRKASERRTALLQIGRDLAKTDPAAGFALIKALAGEVSYFRDGGNGDVSLVCQGFFETLAGLNINEALAMAQELPHQLHRPGMGTVMKTWAGSDLTAAVAYLDKLPEEFARRGVESVYGVWGEKDPTAALGGALKFKNPESGRFFQTAVMSALDGWAGSDGKSAWAYALNPDDSLKDLLSARGPYLGMIAARWAEKDLDVALAAIRALSAGSGSTQGPAADGAGAVDHGYQRLVEFMTLRLTETAPEAAGKLFDREKWLAGNPWLSSRNVNRLMDEGSVGEAAEWMAMIPDKNAAFDAARQLASRRTASDYDSVFKWANMIQDDYVKAGALSNVAAQQAMNDMNKPIDWIYDLPQGFPKDRSIAGFILGRLRRTGDREAEMELKQQLNENRFDMAGLTRIVEKSKMNPLEKTDLFNLVDGRRPPRPLVIQ